MIRNNSIGIHSDRNPFKIMGWRFRWFGEMEFPLFFYNLMQKNQTKTKTSLPQGITEVFALITVLQVRGKTLSTS